MYCELLNKLRPLPTSVETLKTLTPFMASAFQRIVPPCLGPFAFESYWKDTYHGKTEFLRNIPVQLEVAMKAFDDVYQRGLTVGSSHEIDSQTTVCI